MECWEKPTHPLLQYSITPAPHHSTRLFSARFDLRIAYWSCEKRQARTALKAQKALGVIQRTANEPALNMNAAACSWVMDRISEPAV